MLSDLVAQLQSIYNKVGVEQIDKLLRNIFDNDIRVKTMQRRIYMSELKNGVIY